MSWVDRDVVMVMRWMVKMAKCWKSAIVGSEGASGSVRVMKV